MTPATTPDVPTGVGAVPGNTSAVVSWVTPTDDGGAAVTGYVVESSCNGGSWAQVAGSPATVSPFTVSGLTEGAVCMFRVAALNSVGQGGWVTSPQILIPLTIHTAGNALADTGSNLPACPLGLAGALATFIGVLTLTTMRRRRRTKRNHSHGAPSA